MSKKVIICGAGVIGATTAYALVQNGFNVHILEKERETAMGTTQGNGCQMASVGIKVMNDMTFLRKAILSLWKKTRGVFWQPEKHFDQWRFLLAPLWEKTVDMDTAVYKLALLASMSLNCMEKIVEQEPSLDSREASLGISTIFRSRQEQDHWENSYKQLRRVGIKIDILSQHEYLAKNPALKQSSFPIYGGAFAENDRISDAHLFTRQLLQKAERLGAQVHKGISIKKFVTNGNSITHAILENGNMVAGDLFVLCTGWHTPSLADSLGDYIPIMNVRGYSATVLRGDLPLHHGVVDHHNSVVFSPVGSYLRIAGFYDVGNLSPQMIEERKNTFCDFFFLLLSCSCKNKED